MSSSKNQQLALVTLLVHDYDEAIRFYTEKLHFILLEDRRISETKRWVRVAPHGNSASSQTCSLLLAKADGEAQQNFIGNQTGGRVFLFLHTDDFWRDYRDMTDQGIEFVRPPSVEPYGTVAVFRDLYGNLWDLIQPVAGEGSAGQ